MLRLTALVATLTLLMASASRADEVRLTNGDRITGQTISMIKGTLLFKTASGSLTIPWGDVTYIDVDNQVYVTVASNSPILTVVSPGSADGTATLDPGGPVQLSDIAAITFTKSVWERTG